MQSTAPEKVPIKNSGRGNSKEAPKKSVLTTAPSQQQLPPKSPPIPAELQTLTLQSLEQAFSLAGCSSRFEKFSTFYRSQIGDQTYEFSNIENFKADLERQVGDQMNFIELDLGET